MLVCHEDEIRFIRTYKYIGKYIFDLLKQLSLTKSKIFFLMVLVMYELRGLKIIWLLLLS